MWTSAEKEAINRHMGKFIHSTMKTPNEKECKKCLLDAGTALRARTWTDVKYFVYNTIKKRVSYISLLMYWISVFWCLPAKDRVYIIFKLESIHVKYTYVYHVYTYIKMSRYLCIFTRMNIYIYLYICIYFSLLMCVCVCVCVCASMSSTYSYDKLV